MEGISLHGQSVTTLSFDREARCFSLLIGRVPEYLDGESRHGHGKGAKVSSSIPFPARFIFDPWGWPNHDSQPLAQTNLCGQRKPRAVCHSHQMSGHKKYSLTKQRPRLSAQSTSSFSFSPLLDVFHNSVILLPRKFFAIRNSCLFFHHRHTVTSEKVVTKANPGSDAV